MNRIEKVRAVFRKTKLELSIRDAFNLIVI